MRRLNLTVQHSLSFLRSHLNSRRFATCIPLRHLHGTMEYESPDWDPTPTEPIEIKDEIQDPTESEPTEPLASNEVKFEIMKKEEDSPPHSNMLCPPVRSFARQNIYNINTTSKSPTCFPHVLPEPFHTHYVAGHSQNNLSPTHSCCSASHGTTNTPIDYVLHQH